MASSSSSQKRDLSAKFYVQRRKVKTENNSVKEVFLTATEQGNVETVLKLIDELHIPPDLTAIREGVGRSALSIASTYGQSHVVAELLKNGANPAIISGIGRIPLHDACINGHFECVQLLVASMSDADLNIPDNSGQTPVHLAAFNGEAQVLKSLIQRGADLTAVDHKGRQPLHLAASRNHVSVLQLLFDAGVDLNSQCSSGKTSLHYSAQFGGLETVKFLVLRDCDTMIEDKTPGLAAHISARYDKLNCLKFLMKQGTSVDTVQKSGKACSHFAAASGAFNVLHWLLDNGASVNLQDSEGNTPAHYAAQAGKADCFNCCGQHDANLDITNAKGDTPLDLAKKSGHPLLMGKAVANIVMCPLCLEKCRKEDYNKRHPLADVEKSIKAIRSKAYTSPLPKINIKQSRETTVVKMSSLTKSNTVLSRSNKQEANLPQRNLLVKFYGEFVDQNQSFKMK